MTTTSTVGSIGLKPSKMKKINALLSMMVALEALGSDSTDTMTITDPYSSLRSSPKRIGKLVGARTEPKIQRNAPCPCGSGIKYKKCCITK